jgi:hypothetical protein
MRPKEVRMAMTDKNSGALLWVGIVIGLVLLAVVLIYALFNGPMRTAEDTPRLRIEPPGIPNKPKLPEPPPLPRGVG